MNAFVIQTHRRRVWPWVVLTLLLCCVALPAALVALVLRALAPAEGEWSTPLKLGPITRPVSVPALIRIATHPIGLTLLDGRRTATPYGSWQWQRASDERLVGHCAPCTLQLAALGPAPVTLPAAQFTLKRNGQNRYDGTLTLGAPGDAHALPLQWHAKLSDTGLAVQAQLDRVPLADAHAVLGSAAVPELERARIEGSVALKLAVMLPEQRVLIEPRIAGFAVDGLGTEALLDAEPPSTCRATRRMDVSGSERLIGWLPRAVVAAEDQRFQEHPGYDLEQLLAAFASNQQAGSTPQGASTLTQQLAKWVYVGDERSAVRKLRELLYAVEMERTLGKGRILQLYLALAPWGEGVCGAEWASRHYLKKPAAKLTPLEAAWLASLLRGGEANGADGVDIARVGWVLASLRGPLSAERRAEQLELLQHWVPPARAGGIVNAAVVNGR